jgi:hypothetical protein
MSSIWFGGRDCATSGLAPSATGFVAIFIASIMAWAAAASGTDQRIAGDYLHARQSVPNDMISHTPIST